MKAGISIGCGILVIIIILNILLGGVCTQYVVEFWCTYLQHKPVTVPFWPCALTGLFLGEFFIPAAVVTLLLSFVL